MKYIDISTAHNISIRYELATVMHRILAWFIDVMILIVYSIFMGLITGGNNILFYLLIFFVWAFYHMAFEILNNGQSIGKKIIKIKVVTLHGRTAKAQDYFLRWIFRLLEVTGTAGIMAIVYISSTEKHQRIGDILAQTTVIKLKSDNFYDLKSLVKLGELNREITYPKITMYNDSDLMLVKDALGRLRKDPNGENEKFALTIARQIASDLDVKLKETKPAVFLETVLVDYISLTR